MAASDDENSSLSDLDSDFEFDSDNDLADENYVDDLESSSLEKPSLDTTPSNAPHISPEATGIVGTPAQPPVETSPENLEKAFLEDQQIYTASYNMPTGASLDTISGPANKKDILHAKYDTSSLKNDLGLTGNDLKAFQKKLTDHTVSLAQDHLTDKSFDELCSFETLLSIHKDIFQDIHPGIAGTARQGNLTRNNVVFPDFNEIQESAESIFNDMRNDERLQPEMLTPESQDTFIEAMAEYYIDLYGTHTFRDGNTRTVGVLFDEVAHRAGFETLFLSLDSAYAKGDHRDQTLAAMTDPEAFPEFVDWMKEGIVYPASEAGAYPSYDQVEFETFKENVEIAREETTQEEQAIDTERFAAIVADLVEDKAATLSSTEKQAISDKYGLDTTTQNRFETNAPETESKDTKNFVENEMERRSRTDISLNAGNLTIR